MAPVTRFLALFCILALAVVACSVTVDLGTGPSSLPAQQVPALDKVSTMVVQTLQAFTQQALSATPTTTPLPTATATATATSTRLPVPATLSVSSATNCYAGPRTNYGFVITIRPGTVVNVVGKDTADNYWIIDVPGYPGTVCWLSGQYASVSGDTGNLPAPATPLPSIYTLSEPRGLRVSCTGESSSDGHGHDGWHDGGEDSSEITVVVRWTNTDPDQTGVRVYRNGYRVATLARGARSYSESLWHHRHHDITYGVQAFNATAVSSIVSVDLDDCR